MFSPEGIGDLALFSSGGLDKLAPLLTWLETLVRRYSPVKSGKIWVYLLCFLLKAQVIWHCFHPGALTNLPLFLPADASISCGWKPWFAGTAVLNLKTWVYLFCFLLNAQVIWHYFHPRALINLPLFFPEDSSILVLGLETLVS
jgi:hypothetical protein